MKFFTWFDQYGWVMQLILFAVIFYYYVKNRNKKVDEKKAHWYRVSGMAFMVFTLVSSCVIALIVHDDPSRFNRIAQPVMWTSIILYVIVSLFIGYSFRPGKKPIDNQFEIKE